MLLYTDIFIKSNGQNIQLSDIQVENKQVQ